MFRTLSFVLVLAALLGLSACSGSPSTSPERSLSVGSGALAPVPPGQDGAYAARQQAQLDSFAAGAAAREAQWQAILSHPGTPGVDYNPRHIDVSYQAGASLPAGLAGLRPEAGLRAGDQLNAILREDAQYEPLTDAIAAKYGFKIRQQVYSGEIRCASFDVPENLDTAQVLDALKRDFAQVIEWATFSRLSHLAWEPNDPMYEDSNNSNGDQWGARRIGCSAAWDFSRGDPSIRIAVVDSGVRISHEELQGRVLDPQSAEFDGINLDVVNGDQTVEDQVGHGTGVAGVICATGNNNRSMLGVAHLCEVLPVKIGNGESFDSFDSVAGVTLARQLGCRVINASWGSYGNFPPEQSAVQACYDNGVVFVAAAGNDNVTNIHYPSAYPNAVGVGATQNSDGRASFSNFGDFIDIAAPGVMIASTYSSATDAYVYNDGTSIATPYVAGAAGLLLSLEPTLTVDEVRELLETTGAPTTGFTEGTVLRLNIGAAIAGAGAVRIYLPELDQLTHGGVLTLRPTIHGDAERVEAWLNGVKVDELTAAPYNFEIDTTGISFGYAGVDFRAFKGGEMFSSMLTLLVDNTQGSYPLTEDFEETARNFLPLDVKGYALELLQSIKQLPDGEWSQDDVQINGPGVWNDVASAAHSGVVCKYFGQGGNSYGSYEIDALVSRKIDLLGVGNPTLVFYQHYNIEDGGSGFDKGWVYVTTDGGATFTPATLHAGGQTKFTGYVPAWTPCEVDLSAFSGQKVQLVLVFESDPAQAGENLGQPAGWWVDKLTVAENYIEEVPTIGDVSVPPNSVYGDVPELSEFNVNVTQPRNVARVRYILDCQPLGVIDESDVVVNLDVEPYTSQITLPHVPNQLALLRVQYFDADDTPGPEKQVPLYIFNQIGDTNADGMVGPGDIDGFNGLIGLSSGDAGYIPLFDSDLDGTIQEYDAAAVGYHWGETFQ